jgi:hypothetical protein
LIRSINPIVIRRGGGFSGLIGYVGRERIAGVSTRVWLERFSAANPRDPLPVYCHELANGLSDQWRRQRLKSALVLFVSGVEGGDVRFWFIHNTQGLNDPDWTHIKPTQTFQAIDDLDTNYVAPALAPGQTKEQLLDTTMFFFGTASLGPQPSSSMRSTRSCARSTFSRFLDSLPSRRSMILRSSIDRGSSSRSASLARSTAYRH